MKNKDSFTEGYIRVIFITILILIGGFSLAFIYKFNAYKFSDTIADWGSFGDYFGGILNPIISLFSLGILAYISYQVSKDTAKDNKKLYQYQRKNEIYMEYNNAIEQVMFARRDLGYLASLANQSINLGKTDLKEYYQTHTVEYFELLKKFEEYRMFFMTFANKYGHFYPDYDFKNTKFLELKMNANEVNDSYNKLFDKIIDLEFLELTPFVKNLAETLTKNLDSLQDFGLFLQEELISDN